MPVAGFRGDGTDRGILICEGAAFDVEHGYANNKHRNVWDCYFSLGSKTRELYTLDLLISMASMAFIMQLYML